MKHSELRLKIVAAMPTASHDALDRLATLAERLLAAELNVTAIRDADAVIERHLLDSARALPLIDALAPGPVVDVGSGGGVPALVLAALSPDRAVHAVEATQRKADFIAATAAAMALDVTVHAQRSEDLARAGSPWRDAFAGVCARALAPPPVAVELCAPLCRVNGRIVLWTGAAADREAIEAAAAALACELEPDVFSGLTTLCKVRPTSPRFPRRPGMAAKRPLA